MINTDQNPAYREELRQPLDRAVIGLDAVVEVFRLTAGEGDPLVSGLHQRLLAGPPNPRGGASRILADRR